MTDSQMNEAWTDDHLTAQQLKWMKEEGRILRGLLQSVPRGTVVDCGCGSARIVTAIDGHFELYVGIDIEEATVATARQLFAEREDVQILDAADFRQALPEVVHATGQRYGVAINTGNTLGVMPDDLDSYTRAMAENSNALFVSVCRHGDSALAARLEYYDKNKIECQVDPETQAITSDMWGVSQAFSHDRLLDIGHSLMQHGFGEPVVLDVDPIGIALWAIRS